MYIIRFILRYNQCDAQGNSSQISNLMSKAMKRDR